MPQELCEGFNVLPKKKCFGLNYKELSLLSDESKTQEIIDKLNDSFIIHYWSNKINVTNAFNVLERTLCPKVMRHVGEIVT